ncbi:MAG: AsmA-like C-terminal region-containing protein [Candidatus Omnitrophota bacterium]
MQEQPRPRGVPFLQKLFFLFILLAVFGSIGLWYVNEYIMPTKGRALVLDYLAGATGREIVLGDVYYNPLRGIILKDLSISDEKKYNRKFLEVKKLYLNILYLPLLQEKKFVVSSVRIESPKIYLTVNEMNEWNFSSLLFLKQAEGRPENVLVNSISVSGGTCVFEDLATEPDFKQEIKDADLSVSLSYPLKVKFRMNSELVMAQKNSVSADGEFYPASGNTAVNLRIKNVPLSEFKPYYDGMPFKSLSGNLTGNISCVYAPGKSLAVATVSSVSGVELERDDFKTKGIVDLTGKMLIDLKDASKLKMPCVITASARIDRLDMSSSGSSPAFAVKGDISANGKFILDLKDKTVVVRYTADTLLRDTKITGVPAFGAIDRINGKIYFDETKLWTDLLKGLAKGFDCVFSGSIKNYSNPFLDLTARTELDLARLDELITPELRDKLKDYKLSGISRISLNLSGALKEQDKTPLSYAVTSELLDCSVKPGFLDKPVRSINGILVIKENSLSLRNITSFYDGKKYLLSGEMKDLKSPACDISLSSDELALKAVFKSRDDSLAFSRFDGRYKDSIFNLSGSVSGIKDPSLEIKGTLKSSISEMARYIPKESREFYDKIDPRASVYAAFAFKGKNRDETTWKIDLTKLEVKSDAENLVLFGTITNLKDPSLDIRGSLETDVENLAKYLPKEQAGPLEQNGIKGIISSKFIFKGRQSDISSWDANLVADAPLIDAKKLKFDSVHLEGKFVGKYLTVSRLTANPYDGSLAINAVFDFNKDKPQYTARVGMRDIDIGRWKDDTGMKDKKISGRFSANADLSGTPGEPGTLKGSGNFKISDGSFWELPVFSGLANILYIPKVSKIIFGQAQGTFTVADKKVRTEDTKMSSPQMDLIGNGTVDFDGNLDFQITAVFDKALIQIPSSLGPLRDLLIDKDGRYLGDIKLNGTTKEPKFDPKPPRLDKIWNNRLFDNIKKGIFGDSSE